MCNGCHTIIHAAHVSTPPRAAAGGIATSTSSSSSKLPSSLFPPAISHQATIKRGTECWDILVPSSSSTTFVLSSEAGPACARSIVVVQPHPSLASSSRRLTTVVCNYTGNTRDLRLLCTYLSCNSRKLTSFPYNHHGTNG